MTSWFDNSDNDGGGDDNSGSNPSMFSCPVCGQLYDASKVGPPYFWAVYSSREGTYMATCDDCFRAGVHMADTVTGHQFRCAVMSPKTPVPALGEGDFLSISWILGTGMFPLATREASLASRVIGLA